MLNLFKAFFRPQLSREALEAYLYRLPNTIQVDWQRDGEFIIGKVSAGQSEFVTQGRTPEEFVEMVNDAVVTVSGIPQPYVDAIQELRAYHPSAEEMRLLGDSSVARAQLLFSKAKRTPVAA